MSLFIAGLGCALSKKGKITMLLGDMDISRLMVFVQQNEQEKLRDREEYTRKISMTGNEFGQKKGTANRSSFK